MTTVRAELVALMPWLLNALPELHETFKPYAPGEDSLAGDANRPGIG